MKTSAAFCAMRDAHVDGGHDIRWRPGSEIEPLFPATASLGGLQLLSENR